GAPSRHLPYSAGPRFRCRILEPRSFGFSSDGPRREATPQSLLDRATRPPSASSWQGTLVTPGGAPAPPGCRRSVRLLPAGAASDPTFITPHDSALGGSDNLE